MVEPKPSERGAALLTVLLLVAVMSVVTAGALERLTLGVRLSSNAAALDQARAFSYAAETLAATRIADLAATDKTKTTLQGNWNGNRFVLPIPGGLGTARVSDGGNCFNVNSVVTGANEVGGAPQLSVRPIGITQFRALMELLGIDNTSAVTIAASTADWIDTDDRPEPNGAESDVYQKAPTPYRTANQLMADPSELRVVNGMTPDIYSKLRPWLCALPVSDLSPINVNTLLPAQAPLFAMLIPGQLSIGQAREVLSQRPQGGYANVTQFWNGPSLKGLTANVEVATQVGMRTRWFAVDSDIELADATVHESALFDAKYAPARLVRRSWADE